MNKVSYEGFGLKCLTFLKASAATIAKGDFVSISADGTVSALSAGEITGKCVDIKGDVVTVQVAGYMTAPILTGETVTYGRCHLALDSDGKLKVTAGARAVLVVSIDSTNGIAGFIL